MQHQSPKKMVEFPLPWSGAENDQTDGIAISSRIRLARNFASTHFPARSDAETLQEVWDKVARGLQSCSLYSSAAWYKMATLDYLDRQVLRERQLISAEMSEKTDRGTGVVVAGEDNVSLMINEEDHLRLQILGHGLQLQNIWPCLIKTERFLNRIFDFAHTEKLGYLSACPTNVGTGLRASVMLHVPGLWLTGKLKKVYNAAEALGLSVRGAAGEESEALGGICQVSNRFTLGESEEDILKRIETTVRRIIWYERNAQRRLLRKQQTEIYDKIGRAYGQLKYGYTVPEDEAVKLLSLVRWGAICGLFSGLNRVNVDDVMRRQQKGHLQILESASHIGREELPSVRGTFLRRSLRNQVQ